MFHYSRIVYKNKVERLPKRPKVEPKLAERGKRGKEYVARIRTLQEKKNELFRQWMENDKKFNEIDPGIEYKVLHFTNRAYARESFFLLRLIKKYYSEEKAQEAYKKSWKGNTFMTDRLAAFFGKNYKNRPAHPNNATAKLGFYYWKEKYKWYVYDEKTGSKDKPIGEYLHRSIGEIRTLFKDGRKKGMEFRHDIGDQLLIVKSLEEISQEIPTKTIARKQLLDWFKKNAKDKWVQLTPREVGLMNFVYLGGGVGSGKYVYRYSNGKIYSLRIKGTKLPNKWTDAGYIDIKAGKLGATWESMTSKQLKKESLDKMSPVEIETDLIAGKKPEKRTKEDNLTLTRGDARIAASKKNLKNVEHNKLQADFYDPLKEVLVKVLKEKYKDKKDKEIEVLASTRMKNIKNQIKGQIDPKIGTNEALKKAINEKPEIKLSITIDSKDEVTVDFATGTDRVKYSKKLKEAKEKATSPKALVDETYGKFKKWIKKTFKGASGMVMMILNLFGNFKEKILKLFKGESAPIASLVLGFAGIKVTRGILGATRVNQAKFDKLVIPKDKKQIILGKTYFNTKVRTKHKVVIPKGGILPGGLMNVIVRGKGSMTIGKAPKTAEEKGKAALKKMVFGAKEEFLFKDKQIVIPKNTIIAQGTIIPKGAKIVRT